MIKNHLKSFKKLIFFVVGKMFWRTIFVCLSHTLSYFLYCLLANEIIEKFYKTIELSLKLEISFHKLIENILNPEIGLMWLLIWLSILIFAAIFDFLSSYLASKLYSESEYIVRNEAINHIYDSSLSDLKKLSSESEGENFIDLAAEGVKEFIEKISHDILPAMIFTILSTIKIFYSFGWQLGTFIISFGILFCLIQYFLFRRAIVFAKDIATSSSKRTDIIVESLRYVLYSKMFKAKDYFIKRFMKCHKIETEVYELYLKNASFTILSTHTLNSICKFCIAFALVFGGILLSKNKGPASLITCLQLITWTMYTLSDQTKHITEVVQSITQTKVALVFLSKFNHCKNQKTQLINNYNISIKNLSFKYNQNTIIDNLSIEIPEGSLICVVGKSGSGKSTLFDILAKLVIPTSGDIYIGGVNLKNISDDQICDIYIYMNQSDGLLNDSIKNNIELGRSSNTYKEIINKTKLKTLVAKVGDDFNVGYGGKHISGGEKRRISIARALLQMKKILFLDEMNSGIDARTSKIIFDNVLSIAQESHTNTATKNKPTIFIIDHYHNVTHKADQVIFINNGTVQVDTHKNLMENNVEYSKNYNSSTID